MTAFQGKSHCDTWDYPCFNFYLVPHIPITANPFLTPPTMSFLLIVPDYTLSQEHIFQDTFLIHSLFVLVQSEYFHDEISYSLYNMAYK